MGEVIDYIAGSLQTFNFWSFLGFLTFSYGRRFMLPEVREKSWKEKLWNGETILGDIAVAILFGIFVADITALESLIIVIVLLSVTWFFIGLRLWYTKQQARQISKHYLVGRDFEKERKEV